MRAPNVADTEAQIKALRRDVAERCVSIASSIDTLPVGTVSPETRERWLHELHQAAGALILVTGYAVGSDASPLEQDKTDDRRERGRGKTSG